MSLMADEIVVSFWAIGPTFRSQLNENLKKYLVNNRDGVFKFTILTDYPEDFEYLHTETNRCLAILDIEQERESFKWSLENEYISKGKTDAEYTKNFRKNLELGKRFSYSLHRFTLPWMIKNNVNKFILLDPDVHFRLNHEGIDSLQTYVDIFFTFDTHIKTNYVIGSGIFQYKDVHTDNYFQHITKATKIVMDMPDIFNTTDGPFRFYNFESVGLVKKFFNVWNQAVKTMFDVRELQHVHGSIFLNDEVLLSVVYSLLKLSIRPVSSQAIHILHRVENRHFMPNSGYYKLADTVEEFIQINKDELLAHYKVDNLTDIHKGVQ